MQQGSVMRSNPISAIQARLVQEMGFKGPVPTRQKYFSFDFEYSGSQHPKAVPLDLVCEFSWSKPNREVHLVVYQPAALLQGWDGAKLKFFYTNLTEAFGDEIRNFVPVWGNYWACVMPYKDSKDDADHYFAYLSRIECEPYNPDEVLELALASFGAGLHVLSHSQSLIGALVRGERVLNVAEHIQKMKDQFSREATFAPV